MASRSSGPRALTVSGLLETARSVLEGEVGRVRVEGEVFEYRGPHASGHYYFKLRDAGASVPVILWRGSAPRALKCRLEEGMKVVVEASFDIYLQRGSLSLILHRVEESGRGDLAARFERLKARLQAEGLFDPASKRVLPERPRRVVIITGRDSAAEADILHSIRARPRALQVHLRYARVQGEGAAEELVAALQDAAATRPDLILLSRGGGSLEDLWAFNEEVLVRAVHACPVPVLSAVGHELDFTLCDFAADGRAITPTAGACEVVRGWQEAAETMQELAAELEACMAERLQRWQRLLERRRHRLALQSPSQRLERLRSRFHHAEQTLQVAGERLVSPRREACRGKAWRLLRQGPEDRLQRLSARLEMARARLTAGDPRQLLQRGYALVERVDAEDGEHGYLRTSAGLLVGQGVRVQLAEGHFRAEVTEVE